MAKLYECISASAAVKCGKAEYPILSITMKDGIVLQSDKFKKRFLFANTPKGASDSAVMFSLIQTAIENGLDPYKYLTWLLKKANNADLTDTQFVQSLLPWNAPQECKTK